MAVLHAAVAVARKANDSARRHLEIWTIRQSDRRRAAGWNEALALIVIRAELKQS